jgi:hypothetical protein
MATVNTMTIGSNLTQDWYGMYPSSHLFGIGNIDYSLNLVGIIGTHLTNKLSIQMVRLWLSRIQ